MSGSTKGTAQTSGQFNNYNVPGGSMPFGSSYQSMYGGQFDPYAQQPPNPYTNVYNAGMQYSGAPVGLGGYDSSYNAKDYGYQVPAYSVGNNENVDELVASIGADAENQMGLMNRSLDQRAAASGMSGGSRHGTAQAAGMDDINRGLMANTTKVRYDANENMLARQQQEALDRRAKELQESQYQQGLSWQNAQSEYQQQQSAEQEAYSRAAAEQARQDSAAAAAAAWNDQYGGTTNSAGRTIAYK